MTLSQCPLLSLKRIVTSDKCDNGGNCEKDDNCDNCDNRYNCDKCEICANCDNCNICDNCDNNDNNVGNLDKDTPR